MTKSPFPRGIVHGVAIVLCLAAVANGAVFWLKRTGFVDAPQYQRYIEQKSSFRLRDRSDPVWPHARRFQSASLVRLYSLSRFQLAAKAAKYGVVAVLVGLFAWWWWRSGDGARSWRQPLLLLFAASMLIAAVQSWRHYGNVFLIPALRSLAFLAVLSTSARFASINTLGILSKYLIYLVLLQASLLPFELLWGLDVYTGGAFASWFGDRAVGVFLQPTSLGLFAAVALSAFLCCADSSERWKFLAVCVTAVVVAASGSASAMLLFVLVAVHAVLARANLPRGARIAALCSLAGMVLWASPWLTGRPDVMASLLGRVDKIVEVLADARSAGTVLFGDGLGVGSNAAFHWIRYLAGAGASVPALGPYAGSDSTPQSLLTQTGMVGCLAFYALWVQCAIRDRQTRPLLIVLGLASLFANLIEFFPIDVLLAMSLARSSLPRNRLNQCPEGGRARVANQRTWREIPVQRA